MTAKFFVEEISRLNRAFNDAYEKKEKQKLIWIEVRDLEDNDFARIVDLCIGEHNINWPPTVSVFREYANQRRKLIQTRNELAAAENYKAQLQDRQRTSKEGLQKALKELGLKSLMEAITKKQQ